MRLAAFGYGYSARALERRLATEGWTTAAITRATIDPAAAAGGADALVITAPPTEAGCPGLAAFEAALRRGDFTPRWIGYLSTTGVYGDHGGGWVTERTAPAPRSREAARRVAAETAWRALGAEAGLCVATFRLPGIYGPGRSAFDRLREGRARRIDAPGQVFSRIHVDDLAAGLAASITRPRPGAVYNLCDDEPAPNSDVIAYAAGLMGIAPPPETPLADAQLPAAAQRFYGESRRVSNALAKAELGWRPAYPTYREGLAVILKG